MSLPILNSSLDCCIISPSYPCFSIEDNPTPPRRRHTAAVKDVKVFQGDLEAIWGKGNSIYTGVEEESATEAAISEALEGKGTEFPPPRRHKILTQILVICASLSPSLPKYSRYLMLFLENKMSFYSLMHTLRPLYAISSLYSVRTVYGGYWIRVIATG